MWVLSFLSLICSHSTLALNTNANMYVIQDNIKIMGIDNMLKHIHTKSEVGCATACTASKLCCVAAYYHSSQECYLDTTWSCDAQTEPDNGVTLLVKLVDGCQYGWERFQSHCYYFSDKRISWHSAENECLHMGAHLVKIANAEESSWIKGKGKRQDIWIGLNDIAVEGKWKWISDNSNVDAGFQDWHKDEPNAGTDCNCAQLWFTNDFKYGWDDTRCEQSGFRVFICKKEV